jgi:hypothetical protein
MVIRWRIVIRAGLSREVIADFWSYADDTKGVGVESLSMRASGSQLQHLQYGSIYLYFQEARARNGSEQSFEAEIEQKNSSSLEPGR